MQEAHGPHLSPEKQFQSITLAQRYDYTITLIKRKKKSLPVSPLEILISFLRIEWSFIYKNL